jgi:hypothetical protein
MFPATFRIQVGDTGVYLAFWVRAERRRLRVAPVALRLPLVARIKRIAARGLEPDGRLKHSADRRIERLKTERTRPMPPTVVLVSRDWQTRALLRAQLIEEGSSVRAYESLRDAAPALKSSLFRPSLLVAELSGDESPPELDQLLALAVRLPVWVLASRSDVAEATLKGRAFEAVLFRPIDLSDLVRRVKRRLKELTH